MQPNRPVSTHYQKTEVPYKTLFNYRVKVQGLNDNPTELKASGYFTILLFRKIHTSNLKKLQVFFQVHRLLLQAKSKVDQVQCGKQI